MIAGKLTVRESKFLSMTAPDAFARVDMGERIDPAKLVRSGGAL